MSNIAEKMKNEGLRLGMRAVSKLMESPSRAEKVMRAVETVQKSRERVDETTQRLLNMSQVASSAEMRDIARQVGRLRREAKRILAVLDEMNVP